MFISARYSRKGMSAFIIWNLILLTSVLTVTKLIEEVELMPNQTLIAPAFKVLITVL